METKEIIAEINDLDLQKWASMGGRCFPEWTKLLSRQKELYYYTDLRAIVNGILRDGGVICLWASRWSHLNDPDEIISTINELNFPQELDWLTDGIKQMIKNNHSISFSEYSDYLPMWKMYGDSGYGAMMIFDTEELLKKWGGLLQPCLYKGSKEYDLAKERVFSPQLHSELKDLTRVQQQYVMLTMLQMFVSITKNDDYLYEKEVRLTGLGNVHFGNKCEQKFRVSNNGIIPYVEAFMPKESLKGICIGPLSKSELNEETLRELLANRGFDNVEVSSSKIHYR